MERGLMYIYKDEKNINIYQDFNGSYGLFLFEDTKKNYFAISNSFLKLVEYLKDKKSLSMNLDNAYSYLTSEFCSTSYKQTLVNEINILPHLILLLLI